MGKEIVYSSNNKVQPYYLRFARGAILLSLKIITWLPSQHLRRWLLKAAGLQLGEKSVIYGGVEIRSPWRIKIGQFVSVGTNSVLDGRGGLRIHDRVNISSEVMIWSLQHDYKKPDFPGYGREVVIEEYVWLGPRVIVLPGVTVAKGCVIAAGAVVTRSTEPYGLYGGVPAKRIGERPQELDYAPGRYYTPMV